MQSFFILIPILLVLYLVYKYSFFLPPIKGLPVLMYHSIDDSLMPGPLNVTPLQFEKQLQYLQRNNYSTILFSDLITCLNENRALPPKVVMITVDDGNKNNFTKMYPLLKKYDARANIFLVSNFINKCSMQTKVDSYLSSEDINQMDPRIIEFGLHTYDHVNYNRLNKEEINADIIKCKQQLSELGIRYSSSFAYTYGAYPKKDLIKRTELFEVLKSNNIELAFRIGNRVNKIPLTNKFLIKRIDIRGTDSFFNFRTKIQKGRVKLF